MAADVTCGLVKRDDASMTYRRSRSPYHGDGISLMVQDITADRSIECGTIWKCVVTSDHEFNLPMSSRERPGLCHFDRAGLAIECNNVAGITDGLGK
jgi:hypothetical protein